MKYCTNCHVDVNTESEKCPLCQNILQETEGKAVQDIFPEIPTVYAQFNLFIRVLIFISVVVSVVSVLVNLVLPETGLWAVLVILGVISVWISSAIIIRKRNNIRKTVMYQVFLVSFISVLWDLVTGWHGWSIDYVVPIVCMVAVIVFAILYKLLHMPIKEYLIYFGITSIFGIIPIVFYLADMLDVVIPSLICVGVSLITIAGLIVFLGHDMVAELKRRLHL